MPSPAQVSLKKANFLSGQGRHKQACEYYLEYLGHVPDSALVRSLLANSLRRAGETEAALEAVRIAVAADPGCAYAQFMGSLVTRDLGDIEESQVMMSEALRLAPENIPYLSAAANHALLDKKPKLAKKLTLSALELDPKHVTSRLTMARILRSEGKHDEGLRMAREVAEEDPENASAIARMASALSDTNLAEAREMYLLALEINPELESAQLGLKRVSKKL